MLRSNARGVRAVQVSQSSRGMPWQSAGEQLAAAVVLHAVTGGRSSQRPDVCYRKRRAKWRVFGLYIPIILSRRIWGLGSTLPQ